MFIVLLLNLKWQFTSYAQAILLIDDSHTNLSKVELNFRHSEKKQQL